MRLLTFTNLYPSEDLPRHGIFVEERLRQLVALGGVEAEVLALRPTPAAFLKRESRTEVRHGLKVEYLPVPTLPLVTNWIDPWLWARAAAPAVRRWLGDRVDDAILDAHFLFPDGVAAVELASRLRIPVVLTARGSDVNVKCNNAVMLRAVRGAARRCAALITVSRALAQRLDQLGVRAPVVEVLRNGVDLARFAPRDPAATRARLGVEGRVLVSVGHLVPDKGHDIVIRALAGLPNTTLLIVGEGPLRSELEALVVRLGVSSRVRFLGLVPHERMAEVYGAADVLVLASAREGMPNVVLESLACDTPVVATDVGGVGEVVTAKVAGALVRKREPDAMRAAIAALLADPPAPGATREFAARLGWAPVVEQQVALYRKVLDGAAYSFAAGARTL